MDVEEETSARPRSTSFVQAEDTARALAEVDEALESFLDGPQRHSLSPRPNDFRKYNCRSFARICSGKYFYYERARQLINDDTYWEIEDRHFSYLVDRAHEYNDSLRARVEVKTDKILCPAWEVIERRCRDLEQHLKGRHLLRILDCGRNYN